MRRRVYQRWVAAPSRPRAGIRCCGCAESAGSWRHRRLRAGATVVAMRDDGPPRPRRRRRGVARRARRARPSPAVDRRPLARRPQADAQRGRDRLDHVQRRDLQPRGAAVGARGQGAHATAPTPTPRRSSTSTRRKARAASSASHGMFAIAIWDERRRELFLARDRLGIKPLYYAEPAGGFVFARRSRRCCAHPAVSPDLDEEAFFHYLTFVCTPAPLTMFTGIRKLAPAERMIVRGRRLRPERHLLDRRCPDARPREVAEMTEARHGGAAARRCSARRSRSA